MNIELNKIGKISKIVGIICTYFSIFVVIFVVIGINKDRTIQDTFAALLCVAILQFLGKAIYSLYDNYKKLQDERIDIKQFKKKWIICLISCILIVLPFIIMGIALAGEAIINLFLFPLIPTVFLFPQFILLKKTNYYSFQFAKKIQNINTGNSDTFLWIKRTLKNTSPAEVVIASLIIGISLGLMLGYQFGEPYDKGDVPPFNYLIGFTSCLISSGISFLILNSFSKKRK